MSVDDFSLLPANMWLRRPLGPWADELLRWCDGRCTINLAAEITTHDEHEISVDMFQKAVLALLYNEPHLRTDADLSATPANWVPATDYSDVFTYDDLRETGAKNISDVWETVETYTNYTWQIGSGKPLYKCTLLRINGGYIVLNIYHHAAADGTSGLLMMGEIMKQYKLLEAGQETEKRPHAPRGPTEDLVAPHIKQGEATDEVVRELIKEKVKRAVEWKPLLPFDMDEHEANKAGAFINKILFRDGNKENYSAIRARCKTEGVSVGSIALAASYMAMAQIHAKTTCDKPAEEYAGMTEQYMDIPVNIRQRIGGISGDEYAGFYVTEVTFKCDVTLGTQLWDLARDIQHQLNTIIQQDQHLLFPTVKSEWEGGETKDLACSSWAEGKISDVIVSNLMYYRYPTDLGWGEISTMACAVSVAIPFCSNLELLFQACNGKFGYTLVYCPGTNNKKYATDYMDAFVHVMETSHRTGALSLKDYLK